MKEVQKTLQEEKDDKEEDEYGGSIEKMEEAEKNLINEINIEEKNFRIEINEETKLINNIQFEIKRKNSQIKKLRNEKKMDEIMKKNKKRIKSITKYQSNSKTTNNIQNKEAQRRHSNYKPKNSPNIGFNLKNNKISNTEKRANLHTPNLMVKNSEKLTKPFEIKKFNAIKNNDKANDEKNNTMFNIYNDVKKIKINSFGDNSSNIDKISLNEKKKKKSKNGISALKEIENLKCEIQNALNNNIVILNDIDEIKKNYYKKEKDEEIFSAYQTGSFAKKTLNEDKKEENGNDNLSNYEKNNFKVEKLLQKEQRTQDYQLKQNDNINEENTKRKPFDKIIFK